MLLLLPQEAMELDRSLAREETVEAKRDAETPAGPSLRHSASPALYRRAAEGLRADSQSNRQLHHVTNNKVLERAAWSYQRKTRDIII